MRKYLLVAVLSFSIAAFGIPVAQAGVAHSP